MYEAHKDYLQAASWFRKAAEQGDALSEYALGLMYYGGLGVTQDYVQAIAWYRKAAKQGYSPAQIELDAIKKGDSSTTSEQMRPLPEDGQIESARAENYLEYNDKTKIGFIKYTVNMEERNLVFIKIEQVCNSKNIAIRSGGTNRINGSAYTTLDEKYSHNLYEIKFQCVY